MQRCRVGVQSKVPGKVDEVTRTTYEWGEGMSTDLMLEKNLPKLPLGGGKIGAVLPAHNFDLNIGKTGVKVSLEFRKRGS